MRRGRLAVAIAVPALLLWLAMGAAAYSVGLIWIDGQTYTGWSAALLVGGVIAPAVTLGGGGFAALIIGLMLWATR